MRKYLWVTILFCLVGMMAQAKDKGRKEIFPDGKPIPDWFRDTTKVDVSQLGKQYVITDYGVKQDSTLVQTKAIQRVIDMASRQGGGVVVVPKGVFLSGSLFFRQGTHLHIMEGGTLKGSDRIAHFKLMKTRIEGQTCTYFSALVNADGIDGFTITGKGTINGNGKNYWEEFWIRRQWNRECTNKDAQRPRLTYISHCKNVTIQDVHLIDSPFWTNHIYWSDHCRFLDCTIFAPTEGIKAPSSDAIDIDACHDILIRGCYMNVNDDAVALKGGKGTWADRDSTNGPNYDIIIENCRYGSVHSCLTLGSESLDDHNILLRNCHSNDANRVLWLKMRPDTPQHYAYVTVDGMTGKTGSFLVVRPWTQFFKPEGREDMPKSMCDHIVMKNIRMSCQNFFDVGTSDKYGLTDFRFENIQVSDEANHFDRDMIANTLIRNVVINGIKQQ